VKLKPQQLAAHLSRGVGKLYLLSGDEPLLVEESLDAIRAAAQQAGFEERESHLVERGFDWAALDAGFRNLSLFATRRIIELRLPTGKPGNPGGQKIVELAGGELTDTLVVFITPALDRKTVKSKWVTTLARVGAWIDHRPPGAAALPRWLAARMKKAGLACDDDALEFLAARVEGNLIAAKQEIDKLVLLAPDRRVTVDVLRQVVSDGARYDVFQLADAALAGNTPRALRILNGLEREGVAAALVVWSLGREAVALASVAWSVDSGQSLSAAMSATKVFPWRQELIGRAARALDAGRARQLVRLARDTERVVKGARPGQPWNALASLTLAMSRNVPPACAKGPGACSAASSAAPSIPFISGICVPGSSCCSGCRSTKFASCRAAGRRIAPHRSLPPSSGWR